MSNNTRRLKVALSVLLSFTLMAQANAAFSLNGTRFIYEEGKKNISFEVTNSSQDTYGGQVWIDNISLSKADVFIVPSPPFFKVKAGSKQINRLMTVSDAIPKDRESLFMLNVQEVPPKPKNTEGNIIAIAMNTRVKLIYRPKVLVEGRKDAEKQLTLMTRDGSVWLKNPTPYYFAVTTVKSNGKALTLKEDALRDLTQLAPYSEVNTRLTGVLGEMSVDALNDWGGVDNYVLR